MESALSARRTVATCTPEAAANSASVSRSERSRSAQSSEARANRRGRSITGISCFRLRPTAFTARSAGGPGRPRRFVRGECWRRRPGPPPRSVRCRTWSLPEGAQRRPTPRQPGRGPQYDLRQPAARGYPNAGTASGRPRVGDSPATAHGRLLRAGELQLGVLVRDPLAGGRLRCRPTFRGRRSLARKIFHGRAGQLYQDGMEDRIGSRPGPDRARAVQHAVGGCRGEPAAGGGLRRP